MEKYKKMWEQKGENHSCGKHTLLQNHAGINSAPAHCICEWCLHFVWCTLPAITKVSNYE